MYDVLGRLIQGTNEAGAVQSRSYGPFNELEAVSQLDADGKTVLEYEELIFDNRGRVESRDRGSQRRLPRIATMF